MKLYNFCSALVKILHLLHWKKNSITVYKCVNFHLMHASLHHTATAAGCITPEELTQNTDSLLQEVKQSHRELKAEIKELKNMVSCMNQMHFPELHMCTRKGAGGKGRKNKCTMPYLPDSRGIARILPELI